MRFTEVCTSQKGAFAGLEVTSPKRLGRCQTRAFCFRWTVVNSFPCSNFWKLQPAQELRFSQSDGLALSDSVLIPAHISHFPHGLQVNRSCSRYANYQRNSAWGWSFGQRFAGASWPDQTRRGQGPGKQTDLEILCSSLHPCWCHTYLLPRPSSFPLT